MNEQEAYRQKAQAQIEKEEARLAQLRAQAREMTADAKLEVLKQADMLETRIGEMKALAGQLKEAGEERWRDIAGRLDAAWKALKTPSGSCDGCDA